MPEDQAIKQVTATPAEVWRKPQVEGVLLKLPSGNYASIRPVGVDTFLAGAEIPDILTPVVADLISSEKGIRLGDVPISQYMIMMKLFNGFCKSCFVSPSIVDEITDPETQILITDVSENDKAFVFQFLGQPARALESFRRQQEESVANMVGGEGDRTVTESVTENQ